MDAKAVVDFVYSVKDTNGPISSLLDDCRLLVSQIFCWRPSQCFREANRCVDVLAKIGATQITDFVSFSAPPPQLAGVFHFD